MSRSTLSPQRLSLPSETETVLSSYTCTITADNTMSTPAAAARSSVEAAATPTVSRSSRKINSQFNQFQTICSPATDDPPTYSQCLKHKPIPPRLDPGSERLPSYNCTVSAEGKFFLQLESISPLHHPTEISVWREVYLVLRGTLISFYRVKAGRAGRLIRSYTLQHAEVGLAQDSTYSVLLPQTRWAHLIPASARRRAWQKDSNLFTEVRQHVLRLRVEMDQFVLAHPSEECIFSLIYAIGAAIDIAPALDERGMPKQCTMPRRRRRQNARAAANGPVGDLSDPALVAEQERLLQEMYPAFAETPQTRGDPQPLVDVREGSMDVLPALEPTPTLEEDDLDLVMMREDFSSGRPESADPSSHHLRPSASRQTTSTSVLSIQSADLSPTVTNTTISLPELDPNVDPETGKWLWSPQTVRPPHQVQRYIRRCIPLLAMDAPRASDVLICHGRRVIVNWNSLLLEDWEMPCPAYGMHEFATVEDRDGVQTNGLSSSAQVNSNKMDTANISSTLNPRREPSSGATSDSDDEITFTPPSAFPLGTPSPDEMTLDLAKLVVSSADGDNKLFTPHHACPPLDSTSPGLQTSTAPPPAPIASKVRRRSAAAAAAAADRELAAEEADRRERLAGLQGVVFCF